MLYQEDIQYVDEKSQTDSDVLDDIKTFIKLALLQVTWTKYGIFMMSTSY